MATLYDEADTLLDQLVKGERNMDDLDEEEVLDMRKRLNPLGQAIKLDSDQGKNYAYSLINLREEYLKKFLMTSVIGYLYKSSDEWGVPDGDYVTPVDELDRDEVTREFITRNVLDGKVVLRREKLPGVSGGENATSEETPENRFRRIIIKDFLDNLFVFNPDKHVRSAYQRNKYDPERTKVKTKKDTKGKSKKEKKLSKKGNEKNMTEEDKNIMTYGRVTGKIPPADLFHNFKYYMDVNYDALRIATRDLYCEKPDLDYVMIIYQDFHNSSDYNEFVHKHEEDVTADIRNCLQNKWTFQASFSKNRDRQQFYNRNTRVLQEIMDNVESGQKLGKDLLQKRIRKKKKQNMEECGPDDEKFIKQYRKEQRAKHKKAGLKEVSEHERAQAELEEQYLNKYDRPSEDLAKNAVEVQTWTHDTRKKKMQPGSFFTKAEDIEQDKTTITGGN